MTPPAPQRRRAADDLNDQIFHYGIELAYVLLLSGLWLVFSLPVVTIGAATSGLYASLLGHLDDGSRAIVRPFLTAFRNTLGVATRHWLVIGPLVAVFGFDAYFYLWLHPGTVGGVILGWTQIGLCAAALAIATYVFAVIGRSASTPPGGGWHFRSAGALIVAGPGWALVTLGVSVGVPSALGWLGFWQFLVFAPGIIGYLNAKVLLRAGVGELDVSHM